MRRLPRRCETGRLRNGGFARPSAYAGLLGRSNPRRCGPTSEWPTVSEASAESFCDSPVF